MTDRRRVSWVVGLLASTSVRLAAVAAAAPAAAAPAAAAPAANCGGFALLGGAQLLCSHTDPTAPTQVCTFSWALLTTSNATSVVEGSFVLPPGSSNLTVYQGSGFAAAASPPIVLCQGSRTGR